MGKTLAEKLWESHVVRSAAGEPDLLFIDQNTGAQVSRWVQVAQQPQPAIAANHA